MKFWQTSQRKFSLDKTLIMAILNVTPDSFSDGKKFFTIDEALKKVEQIVAEGAHILDIGGESSRPNSRRISAEEEIRRVAPVIEAVKKRFEIPISIDTNKAVVAKKSIEYGAEIINDISGLRFDTKMAETAAKYETGLVLMHLRGTFATMHQQSPVDDILREVANGFRFSLAEAERGGVTKEKIALDVGIGFSKPFEQSLELLAKLAKLSADFSDYPLLVGASRKSFIGKVLGGTVATERLNGSLASAAIAVWNGAKILRVHDVKATVETVKVVEAIKNKL